MPRSGPRERMITVDCASVVPRALSRPCTFHLATALGSLARTPGPVPWAFALLCSYLR